MTDTTTELGIDRAMRKGQAAGRTGGVFFCEITDTLRTWPKNDLLAARPVEGVGSFAPCPEAGSGIGEKLLGLALSDAEAGGCADPYVVADRLTDALAPLFAPPPPTPSFADFLHSLLNDGGK